MIFLPRPLSQTTLKKEILESDKKSCRRFGPCGVGKQALYLNSIYIDRMYYIPVSSIRRVFKRVAMSRGGFTGKGLFASIPYLVVIYDNGLEKKCQFKREEEADEMLVYLSRQFPQIRTVSESSEKKLAQRTREEASRPKIKITSCAGREAERLERARSFLEKRPVLAEKLSRAAKAKRVNERSNPAYRRAALAIVLLGLAAAAFGIWSFITESGSSGLYFLLFGLAAVFLFAGANVLPTKRNNRQYIDRQWQEVCEEMDRYLKGYPGFPVPACYAHPITLTRMIRVIREGRADDAKKALQVVKDDLKALNSDVKVEQAEYDEVVTIKPMFLVENYR
ncbi:MAG: ATPase P [Candidatus Choladocola sp.]|nr:ATPase P [Candidatus Choladocola sp.]